MILKDTHMVNTAYHEIIFKSLQDMRSVKPVIMVLTIPSRIQTLDIMVNALGFKAIFPELTVETIKLLKASSKAVVIDTAAFITQKDTKILDILGKNFINNYGVVNICDTAILYGIPYLTALKNILKYQSPLCTIGYNIPSDNVHKIIQKSGQSLLGFKSSKKTEILTLNLCDDIVHKKDDTQLKIVGLDNVNHVLNIPSILYATLAAALMVVNQDKDMCALASAVLLRAASRRAISVTSGPGSYMPVFLDSLFHLKRDYIYQVQIESHTIKDNIF